MNDLAVHSLLVDIDEAAALLSTGRRTVELLLSRGELPSLLISRRCRRIRRADIEAFIASRLDSEADNVQVEATTPEATALLARARSSRNEVAGASRTRRPKRRLDGAEQLPRSA